MTRNVATRTVRRRAEVHEVGGEICVLGSGAAGMSAALEATRLGRRVVVVDAAPQPGGQAVGAVIGTFCGLYANGPDPYRVTYGIADDLLHHLRQTGGGRPRRARNTLIVEYDPVVLARWIEERFRAAGLTLLLSAVLRGVEVEDGRVRRLRLATRWGDAEVVADGFVDASGDAALAWHAGLELREPETPIYGTLMFTLEGVNRAAAEAIPRADYHARLAERGAAYGLVRRDGFVFSCGEEGVALVNMTHVETPSEPVGASRALLEGRAQVDRLVAFLKDEFPAAFAKARVRTYGLPGIRQSRWIRARHHLTVEEVQRGARFADAVLRCAWPIELHDTPEHVYWEEFGDDHMHYLPFAAMTPVGLDNVVVAGRCIDADAAALSSVRVMGPCIAMGAAASHALDLAGAGSVHQIDIAALQRRLSDNLVREDRDDWSA